MLINKKIKFIHSQPHVYILDSENIYDYIHANYILIQGYSTFYIESLMVNNNVIICQYTKICDSLETDQFNLLKSKNINELQYILDNINSIVDKEYIERIDKYKKYIGLSDVGTISKKIIGKKV